MLHPFFGTNSGKICAISLNLLSRLSISACPLCCSSLLVTEKRTLQSILSYFDSCRLHSTTNTTNDFPGSTMLCPRLDLHANFDLVPKRTKWPGCCGIESDAAPVNRVSSLTWLLYCAKIYMRFALRIKDHNKSIFHAEVLISIFITNISELCRIIIFLQ